MVVQGISPLIWRRRLLCSDMSLATLHATLQIVFAWSGVRAEDQRTSRFCNSTGRRYRWHVACVERCHVISRVTVHAT